MIGTLSLIYLLAFQLCAVPAIIRVVRRQSSGDLSLWREAFLLIGVSAQFAVMTLTGASWWVRISPLASGLNVALLLGAICWYRRR